MSIRTIIAVIIAIAVLAAGVFFTFQAKSVGVEDALAILMRADPEASLLCAIAGWGALAAAVLGVLATIAAFFAEEDDDGYRRRGFPKIVPVALILVSLVLFWTMFDCARLTAAAEPETVVAPVTPEPAPPAEEPQLAGAEEETPPAAPQIAVDPSIYEWPYMIPLIRDGGYEDSGELRRALNAVFPANDPDGRIRGALCGAGWVAVAGAASEEGPAERNAARSRIRAELAANAAKRWLDAHADDCVRPIILGLDLGQHSPTLSAVGDGSDTAFQRSVIIVSGMRRSADESVSFSDAMREAQDALDDPATLREVMKGRRYERAPTLFIPDPSS